MVSMRFSIRIGKVFLSEEQLDRSTDRLSRQLDRKGFEGALHVTINDKEMMGEAQCDYVDALFAYLVNGIDDIFSGRPYSTYFPDMPLQLSITPLHDFVLFSVGDRKSKAHRIEFLQELYGVCRRFYELMSRVFPSGWDAPNLKKLVELPARYPEVLGTMKQ